MSRFAVLCIAMCAIVAMVSAQTLYFSNAGVRRWELESCSDCPVTAPCWSQPNYIYIMSSPCNFVFIDGINATTFRYMGSQTIDVSGLPGTVFATPARVNTNIYNFALNFPNAKINIHDITVNLSRGAFTVSGSQSVDLQRVNLTGMSVSDDNSRMIITALNNVTVSDSHAATPVQTTGNWEMTALRVIANNTGPAAQVGGTPFPIYLNNISCTTNGQSMFFAYAGSPEQQPGTNKRELGDTSRYAVYATNSTTGGCAPAAGQIVNARWENIDMGSAYGAIGRSQGINNRPVNFTFINVNRTINPKGGLRLSYGIYIPSNVSLTMIDSNIQDLQFPQSLTDGQWTLVNSPSDFTYVRYTYNVEQFSYLPYPMYIESSTKHNSILNGQYTSHNTSGATLYMGPGSYDLTGSTFGNNLTALNPSGYTPEQLAAVQLAGGSYYFGDTTSTAETTVPSFLVINANDSTIAHDGPIVLTGDILGGVSGSGSSGANGALSFTGPTVVFESISIGNYALSFSANTDVVYRVTKPSAGIALADVRTLNVSSIAVSWSNSVAGSAPTPGTAYLLAKPVSAKIDATDASGQYIVTSSYDSGTQASYFTFTTTNPDAPPYAPEATPSTNTPSSTPTSTPSSTPSTSGPSAVPNPANPPVAPGTPSATPDQYHEPTDAAVITSAALALPAFAIALIAALL